MHSVHSLQKPVPWSSYVKCIMNIFYCTEICTLPSSRVVQCVRWCTIIFWAFLRRYSQVADLKVHKVHPWEQREMWRTSWYHSCCCYDWCNAVYPQDVTIKEQGRYRRVTMWGNGLSIWFSCKCSLLIGLKFIFMNSLSSATVASYLTPFFVTHYLIYHDIHTVCTQDKYVYRVLL